MTNKPETPGAETPEELKIHRDELEEVVAVAAQLQNAGKEDEDTVFKGDAIDTIVETTGVSREALAEAKQVIKTRKERQLWISVGVAAVLLVGGLLAFPIVWEKTHPAPPQTRALQVETLIAQAREALDKGQDATAVFKAMKATQMDPENFRAWNALGRAYTEQKRLVEASQAYEKGIAIAGIQPEAVELHCNYGTLLTKTPSTREAAVAAFKKALECDPHHARTHNNLAWAYELMKRKPEAFQYYKRAVELNPNDAKYRKNYDEAVTTWTPAEKGIRP